MKDYVRAVVTEAMLQFVSAGYGVVSPIWGERKAQTCMASLLERSMDAWEPLGVVPVMVSLLPNRFALAVSMMMLALACLSAGCGWE